MSNNSNVNIVEREVFNHILPWIKEKEIIAINGPRQAGKTTLINKIKESLPADSVVYISFENNQSLSSFITSPKEFVLAYLQNKNKVYFLFDEFQYVKNGGKILKELFDSFPQAKFIITGSASLAIREIASALVGRIIYINLYPFSFGESLLLQEKPLYNYWKKNNNFFKNYLKTGFIDYLPKLIFSDELKKSFESYLTFGGYPRVNTINTSLKQETLNNLIETYVEKDIIKYLKVGDFMEFQNFVKSLSAINGGMLNYSSISKELGIPYRQIKQSLSQLENTFILKLINTYATNKTTEIKKTPKSYFLDTGLRNSLINDFRAIDSRQDKGNLVESFVFQQLYFRRKLDNNFRYEIKYWRTKQGAEVDFVIEFQNELIPIEVKYQESSDTNITRSFQNFLNKYKQRKAIVITKNLLTIKKYQDIWVLFFPVYLL